MTLRQKIVTGMVWLGGLAALAGISGCGSPWEMEWFDEQGCWHAVELGTEYVNCPGKGSFHRPYNNSAYQQNLNRQNQLIEGIGTGVLLRK